MIESSDIKNGQVFQPFADKANELVQYQFGRWLHSTDGGKKYTYEPTMQEQNKANALAPGSVRIKEKVYEKITRRFDKEKWDAQTRAFQEDAKKPLTQRRFLPTGLGISDSFTHHFEEEIEGALINADATSFLILLELSCQGMIKSIPNFDPVFYLHDVARRVDRKLDHKQVVYSLEAIIYQQTVKTIKDKIAALINHYQPLFPDDLPEEKKASKPKAKKRPPSTKSNETNFECYIEIEYMTDFMSHLIRSYTDQKPEQYGFMLYALVDLGYIPASTLRANQTALHLALQNTFGNVGSRQNLNMAINRLDEKEINREDKRQILIHKKRIEAFLSSPKSK